MVTMTACPDCGATVATCDNNVRLDLPAVEYDRDPAGACWTIMRVGPLDLASCGDPGIGARGHTLHEHQPKEIQ